MKYGVIVKALRVRKNWTQDQLARKLHMSRSAISKIENDEQTLDVPTLVNLVQITGEPAVAVSILLGMDGITIMQSLLQMIGLG